MKVDVVMCTWNSDKPYFEKCLQSIAREVPVHHFIVVDSFSADGTVDVVKRHFPDAIIIKKRTDLANKRRLGINYVDTQIFAFVDDDVVLSKGWLKKLLPSLQENDVGAVQGMAVPSYTIFQHVKYDTRKVVLTRTSPEFYRGYTHNTLIKTDLVKDWHPIVPCAAEDVLLKRHVLSKNKTWVYEQSVTVSHFIFDDKPTLQKQFRKTAWGGANLRIVGFFNSTYKRIRRSAYRILVALKLGITSSDAYFFLYESTASIGYLVGYLRWNKYK